MRTNLLINCPNHTDATSFYRGIGPLSVLRRQMDINLNFSEVYNWAILRMSDVLFMQRPYKQKHLEIMEMAAANKLKVWVDYDDDLFNVPETNPVAHVYNSNETKEVVAKCIARADHVSVSTPFLKAQFEKLDPPLNRNITVIPNALDETLLHYRTAPGDRDPLIMWRGSPTHNQDLWTFQKEIVRAVDKHKTWTFLFQGDRPFFLSQQLKSNSYFGENLDAIEYFEMIHKLKPMIVIVPLEDSIFNRSKSNIAWVEAVFAGAVCLAPDWEEWRRPGCVTYKNPKDFAEKLDLLIEAGPTTINQMNQEGWTHIVDTLTVTKMNERRMKIINQLGYEKQTNLR